VFCAPSLRGESFGVVLIEAMAAGTAIVASDLPGYRRVARPDVDALLTPPGDTLSLAAALKRVLADDDLAGRLRANGLERAEDFSMRTLAGAYLDRFNALLAAQPVERHRSEPNAHLPGWLRRIMPLS